MRNILILTKTFLLNGLGGLRGKRSRTKGTIGIGVIALLYCALFALLTYLQMLTTAEYAEYGAAFYALGTGYTMGIFLTLCFAFQTITGGQRANDTEMLLAMPIKKNEIMIAKALSRYVLNLLITALIILPNIIAYMRYTAFSGVALLGNIVSVLMIPLITVGLTYIIDFVMTTCLPNFKYANVLKAIVTIALLIALVFVYEYVILSTDLVTMEKAVNYVLTFNPIFMLILITGASAIFAIGVVLFAILMNRESRTTVAKTVKLVGKKTTPFRSLLKNETNRYLNSTVLMINTLLGPLAIIALTLWLAIDHCQTFMPLLNMFALDANFVCLLVMALFSSLAVLTYPTAFSISLEGKQFWILQSMPIKPNTVLSAKALFGVLFLSPIMLTCSILLQVVMRFNVWYFISLLLVPVLMNVTIAFGGVLVNLFFPKFNAESDVAVVKNSMSSFIMMFGGLVIVGLFSYLYYVLLSSNLATILVLLIPLLLLVVIATLMVILTLTLGKRIFKRL